MNLLISNLSFYKRALEGTYNRGHKIQYLDRLYFVTVNITCMFTSIKARPQQYKQHFKIECL
jgi:hypothetical protein